MAVGRCKIGVKNYIYSTKLVLTGIVSRYILIHHMPVANDNATKVLRLLSNAPRLLTDLQCQEIENIKNTGVDNTSLIYSMCLTAVNDLHRTGFLNLVKRIGKQDLAHDTYIVVFESLRDDKIKEIKTIYYYIRKTAYFILRYMVFKLKLKQESNTKDHIDMLDYSKTPNHRDFVSVEQKVINDDLIQYLLSVKSVPNMPRNILFGVLNGEDKESCLARLGITGKQYELGKSRGKDIVLGLMDKKDDEFYSSYRVKRKLTTREQQRQILEAKYVKRLELRGVKRTERLGPAVSASTSVADESTAKHT